jgi:hypothetical protein
MKREVKFTPAYNRGAQGGIHGVELEFAVVGELGAVTFKIFTNWQLPEVRENMLNSSTSFGYVQKYPFTFVMEPIPADLGFHSRLPAYEGQQYMSECTYTPEGEGCYYDGSSMAAVNLFDVLVAEGSDGVWRELESKYELEYGEFR